MDISYNKHQGNDASNAANVRVNPSKRATRDRILTFICAHHGVTSKDIQAHLRKMVGHPDNWPMNAFSGRITELKEQGLIDRLPALHEGLQVWVKYQPQMSLLGGWWTWQSSFTTVRVGAKRTPSSPR